MRMFFLLLSISILFFSCSKQEGKPQGKSKSPNLDAFIKEPVIVVKEELIEIPDPEPVYTKYTDLDSTIIDDIQILDKKYASVPFFVKLNHKNYYVTCTGKYNHRMERFDGSLKYGLANDSLNLLLQPEYDKIYNPNITLNNCFEIKRNSKTGLVNYQTLEILQPQFDFILPNFGFGRDKAYGFKNQKWFEIKHTALNLPKEIAFDPTQVLKALSYSIDNIGENMMFDSYYKYNDNEANEGRGIAIVPSYIEYFNLLSNDSYTDVILPDQQSRVDFGTEQARLKTSLQRNISNKVSSFFVSIYESGIDARGYQMEAKELVVLNRGSNTMNSIRLGSHSKWDYFCTESGYRFINDSIIEVKSNQSKSSRSDQSYDFETNFKYLLISKDGSIIELISTRYYDFTKFIVIDESNLKGCFAWHNDEPSSSDENNMWMTDHLSIRDLDIMRNEIFAEYGYKFKTEKWQAYFSSKSWYQPMHDDVTNKLTEIDKENIKLILEVKEKMQNNEESFTHKRPSRYHAAG